LVEVEVEGESNLSKSFPTYLSQHHGIMDKSERFVLANKVYRDTVILSRRNFSISLKIRKYFATPIQHPSTD